MPQAIRPKAHCFTDPLATTLLIIFMLGSASYIHAGASIDLNTDDNDAWRDLTDTLPLVVHVIHTGTPVGAPDNPADSLIHNLVAEINHAFQKDGPFYGGANIELAFKLAARSPQCTNTSGINRINGSGVSHYVTGGITTDTVFYPGSAHELHVKALSRWPNTDYINIWIVNMIDGDPNGLEGYAYFPQYNSALIDGIVLKASAVNGANKNIIHELGHVFSLYHTFGDAWENCIPETDCATQGDLICDTEPCVYMYDCTASINPCTMQPWIIVDPQFNYTVLNNYMGYTDCKWMFTQDQKTVMLDALDNYRPGLLSSLALQAPSGQMPATACTPVALNALSPYYGIERVEFGTLNVYSNTSQADGQFYIDRTCNQQVVVRAGDNVPVTITASYQNWSHIKVFLDYNNNGNFDLPNELIMNGDGGSLSAMIVIPSSSIPYCVPLRLRVVTDPPAAPLPSACLLTGTPADGVGQIEDYAVVIKPRQVQSVASGNWNNLAVWTCNCIPSGTDAIVIQPGHTITVPLNLGTVQCASLQLMTGGSLHALANVHVAGGCE